MSSPTRADLYRKIQERFVQRYRQADFDRVLEDARSIVESRTRPPWFFDVKSVIHPAVTVDERCIITDCSEIFESLFRTAGGHGPKGDDYYDFFHRFTMYPFDLKTFRVYRERHAVDVILEVLGKEGEVDQLPVFVELREPIDAVPAVTGLGGAVLAVSCVVQNAFNGFQSIMPIISDRVNFTRLIETLGNEAYAAILHDFRSPVAGLSMSYYGLMQAHAEGNHERSAFYMGALGKHIEGFKELLNSFPLPSADKKPYVDVIGALESALSAIMKLRRAVQAQVDYSGHALRPGEFELALPLPWLTVEQAFRLVIRNAFDALDSPELPFTRRKIAIKSFTTEKGIEIQIADTGVGTSDDVLAESLEDHHWSEKGSAHGTGLALANSIMKAIGGSIKGHSIPKKGTTVTVSLPAFKHRREG